MGMDAEFQQTNWTLVINARGTTPEAKEALSDLCAVYYRPVIAFIRREGRDEEAAREVAHAFFESVLEKGMGKPDPELGRFRSYLLGALKHFLSKQRDASHTMKRGGKVEHVGLVEEGETAPGSLMPGVVDDTLAFDREWASSLIFRALENLESEHVGKESRFEVLKPWLNAVGLNSQAEAALALGMSGAAVKVAIHRLRTRFRELVRTEVAATVADVNEVGDELSYLIKVTSAGR
ncbi:MAG: DNA-directed RNA polymerase specialized sigma24 family protein [Akkermansiaceae bacterium]|jgi:DNA-directed RNA polymerase specialized sigma24 family protein